MKCPNCNAEIKFFSYFINTNKLACKSCDSKFEIKRKGFQFWFPGIIALISGFISSLVSRYYCPEHFSFSYFFVFFLVYFLIASAGYWFLWKFWKFEYEKRWT